MQEVGAVEDRRGPGNWGRWGPTDERGALNLATSARVLDAAHACRSGKVYGLGLPIGSRTPKVADRPQPQRLTWSGPGDEQYHARFGAPVGVGSNEEVLVIPTHSGTHMDGLSHVYSEERFYNGVPADTFSPRRGSASLGVEATAVVVARGVLLDVAALHGKAHLESSHVVTAEELEACADAQGTEVRPGDALLVRTGFVEGHLGPERLGGDRQPGLGLDAVRYVSERDVAVVGSDNAAVEVLPFDGDRYLGVHIALLVDLGVRLFEHLWLAELGADQCHEFLFVAAALPVVGATGSPVNPVAIA